MINQSLKEFKARETAAEIFSSAVCPLKCQYCYIPKTEAMQGLQTKIIEKLKDKSFITDLKKFYGKDLTALGLWGAEPTLTLGIFGETLPELLKNFPSLNSITFSTSLMTSPDIVLNFIKILAQQEKKINLNIQISLDGPAFVVDVNRIKGSAKKAPENLFYLTEQLNKLDLKNTSVSFAFKPTLTFQNIKVLNKNNGAFKKYFDYFDNIFREYQAKNKNTKIKLNYSPYPTLVVPGRYTSADGKNLAFFFQNLRKLAQKNKSHHYWKHINGSLNTYAYRFDRLIKNQGELFAKPYNFTCSGGDSNFGLGVMNEFHICHRMFFLNHPEYSQSVLSQGGIENWDVSLFSKGNIDLANKNYLMDTKKPEDWPRIKYILRNYHDFTKFKNSYTITILKELANCGQADKEYLKDDNLCFMLALFLNSALSCPTENLLNTGSIHFMPVSLVRLFGNGAFLEVLKDHYENISRRK